MGPQKNSTKTQQSGHTPRSEPEVEVGRNSAKDGAPKRLSRCGIIQKESELDPASDVHRLC